MIIKSNSKVRRALASIDDSFHGKVGVRANEIPAHPHLNGEFSPEMLRDWMSWQDVSEVIIERRYTAILAFSDKAFHFFVPAYMKWVLKHSGLESDISDALVFALSLPDVDIKYPKQYSDHFSRAQCMAVVAFLQAIISIKKQGIEWSIIRKRLKRGDIVIQGRLDELKQAVQLWIKGSRVAHTNL